MAIELGTTDISKIEIGTTNIKNVILGTNVSPIYINIYDAGTQSYTMTTGYSTGTDGSVTYGGSYITIQAGYSGTNSTTNERTARTSGTVDLTNIKTLYVTFDSYISGGTSQNFYFIASTSATGTFGTFNARASLSNAFISGTTTLSLSTSGLTGSYYIRLHQRDGSTSSLNGAGVEIKRIWGI